MFEALVGTDWAGRRFTTYKELLGIDEEKGYYKTSSKKSGYEKGDPKFGKLVGQTVTYDYQKRGSIGLDQVPSYVLSQIKGSQPVQVQYLIALINGEIEAFDAVMNSLGLGVKSTYGEGTVLDKARQMLSKDNPKREDVIKTIRSLRLKLKEARKDKNEEDVNKIREMITKLRAKHGV